MTKQDMFDKVWDHFITKNAPFSAVPLGNGEGLVISYKCRYRGDNGAKCAAGLFIDDEHYDPDFENSGVGDVFVQEALMNSGFPIDLIPFLRELQNAHDGAFRVTDTENKENLNSRLREIAKTHQLEIPA